MKSLFITIALLAAISVSAQTSKGSFLIGGDISFSHKKEDVPSAQYGGFKAIYNSYYFQPQGGLFIVNNLCVGLSLPVSISRRTYNPGSSESKSNSRSWGVGPFVRYYIPVAPSLSVITDGSFTWSSLKSENSYGSGTATSKYSLTTLQVGAGLAYFLSPHTSLELLAQYSHSVEWVKEGNHYPVISDLLSLNLGLRVFIPSKKE